MSDLIREIDEEVSKERSEQFWQKWALPVGIFLTILIVGLFIYFNWQARTQAAALACADGYDAALNALATDPLTAEAQLAAVDANCGSYTQLAAFKLAETQLAQGDDAAAVATWQAFAADAGNQANLRNLARKEIAWYGNGVISAAEVEAEIAYLKTLPAYATYTPVLRAVAALESGDVDSARGFLDSVLSDEDANTAAREFALSVSGLVNDL